MQQKGEGLSDLYSLSQGLINLLIYSLTVYLLHSTLESFS